MSKAKYFLILLICFCVQITAAKSLNAGKSGGHEADIYSVLPFAKCAKISELIYEIHRTIDFPIGYFEGLRDAPHDDFTWHKYGHRVFFHWGFNGNPRSGAVLQSLVTERKWSATVTEAFWQKVIAEQSRRNRETMQTTARILNFQSAGVQRTYSNAFASIVNDVHILGDFSTTNIEALQSIDMVVSDLKKAMIQSLRGAEKATEIARQLDATKNIKSSPERAKKIISILQANLPQMILAAQNGWFARHFSQMGLVMR